MVVSVVEPPVQQAWLLVSVQRNHTGLVRAPVTISYTMYTAWGVVQVTVSSPTQSQNLVPLVGTQALLVVEPTEH